MIKSYWKKGGKQKRITIFVTLLLLVLLFFFRDDYQPVLLFIRKYIFVILISLLILILGLRKFRKTASTGSRLGILAVLIIFFGILYVVGWHYKMYDYMKTYNVFNSLNKV